MICELKLNFFFNTKEKKIKKGEFNPKIDIETRGYKL